MIVLIGSDGRVLEIEQDDCAVTIAGGAVWLGRFIGMFMDEPVIEWLHSLDFPRGCTRAVKVWVHPEMCLEQ